ncbi:MAG: outer membrane protein transport protein, partial [Verrucomicrobiota bacterium]
IGGEWDVSDDLTLRAGYAYWETPTREVTFHPSIPEAERHNVSLGVGRTLKNGSTLDLAWTGMFLEDRDVKTNQDPAFNGEYTFNVHILALSYTHDF